MDERRNPQPEPTAATQREGSGQDGGWRKFAEPRGWSVRWDGFALSRIWDRRNGRPSDGKAR